MYFELNWKAFLFVKLKDVIKDHREKERTDNNNHLIISNNQGSKKKEHAYKCKHEKKKKKKSFSVYLAKQKNKRI